MASMAANALPTSGTRASGDNGSQRSISNAIQTNDFQSHKGHVTPGIEHSISGYMTSVTRISELLAQRRVDARARGVAKNNAPYRYTEADLVYVETELGRPVRLHEWLDAGVAFVSGFGLSRAWPHDHGDREAVPFP